MKRSIAAFCGISLFLLPSCIFDPPKEGKVIQVFNQTNEPIIVLHSIKEGNPIRMYRTDTMNKRKHIFRAPEVASEYGTIDVFFESGVLNDAKRALQLYIVKASDSGKPITEILNNHLYRIIDLNHTEINKEKMNCLFIYPDTIMLEHDLNVGG